MPAIIDHDAVKMNILAAFQSCIEERTITQIPLRMVAERAGMSHSKLLYYFKSKHDLLVSYVRYTREYMTEKCVAWFAEHPRENYGSNLDYMNAFMEYVAVGKPGEVRRTPPRRPTFLPATTMRSAALCARNSPSGGASWSGA